MPGESSANLPGVAADESPERLIIHVDMDCFYAACERLREPTLRDEPVVIGMGYDADDPQGAVATASYEARALGVESAMPISTALEKLPRRADRGEEDDAEDDTASGFYRPVDMEFYQEISADVREILRSYAETFEPVSIDEAYLDVTGRTDWSNVRDYARRIKAHIREDAGVTASIGIAPTKSGAKVASDHDKPDGLVVVKPGELATFFEPLDIDNVHGIGPVTAEELRTMGIETAGDLADADPAALEEAFGSRGREFYNRAHGIDPREVTPPADPKSLSRETSVGEPITDIDEKRAVVRELAQAVARRATEKNALYRTVGIKVVTPPFDVNTRAESLAGPVDDPAVVERIALELLEEFAADRIRKLGVRVSNLSFSEREQVDLDQWAGGPDSSTRGRSEVTASGSRSTSGGSSDGSSPSEPDAGSAVDRDHRVPVENGWQLTLAAFIE